MIPVRLGAVAYLNARPLVYGLERQERFSLRFDPPSRCASLLHENSIDLGMIPTIEYCRGPEYRIVPGMAIISRGPVASVALFTRKPLNEVRTIAADTSSRTSNALIRILCAERFHIRPEFTPMPPDPDAMFDACDAALIIGDPALYLDPAEKRVDKIDLGVEWVSLTGLPFVWAFWAGRPDVLQAEDVEALSAARDSGVTNADAIADGYCGSELAQLGRQYLRDNIQYRLEDRDVAGLKCYYELAAKHGLIASPREALFY
jgi:chorismate dehydratase